VPSIAITERSRATRHAHRAQDHLVRIVYDATGTRARHQRTVGHVGAIRKDLGGDRQPGAPTLPHEVRSRQTEEYE
jgi:hypothetical protein